MLECNLDDNDVLQLPAEDEILLQKLREESRAVFLQRKSRELLDNEELQVKLTNKHNLLTSTLKTKLCVSSTLLCLSVESLVSAG